MQEEEEIPANSSTSRKRKHETEPQTPQEKTKMKLDEEYESLIKIKLKFVEMKRGEIPALHFAARVSDVDVCRRLVEQGADVNEKCGVLGATPLHYAALNKAHGDGIIDFLVGKGCQTFKRDAHFDEAINYAIQAGNFRPAMRLHIHSKTQYGGEATVSGWLNFCIIQNHLKFAKIVYNDYKDKDVLWEHPYDRFTILETACQFGDLEMCKWLLEEVEIDVNKFVDEDWKEQVLYSVARNQKNEASKILQYLFSRFQFTAAQQRNAYRSAFLHKLGQYSFCVKELEELFKRVADTKLKIEGKTLLQYCVSENRLSAAKFVHEKDGELINEINEDGATILHLAAQFGDAEIFMWLIDQGQDLDAMNKQTFANFLHYAAQNRWYGNSIIQEFGRDLRGIVNRIDENVYTPLHYALLNERHNKVAEALLGLGADLSVKRKGNNFLHFCIVNRMLGSAKFVHAKDQNLIKQRGEGGKTTLHIAADHFDVETCAWLVSEGADPQETTVGGKTVLESTRSENAKKFLRSLITTKK